MTDIEARRERLRQILEDRRAILDKYTRRVMALDRLTGEDVEERRRTCIRAYLEACARDWHE